MVTLIGLTPIGPSLIAEFLNHAARILIIAFTKICLLKMQLAFGSRYNMFLWLIRKKKNEIVFVLKFDFKGCFKKVFVTIEHNYALIGGVSFASSVFILFGSLLSCSLAKNLSKHRYETMQ